MHGGGNVRFDSVGCVGFFMGIISVTSLFGFVFLYGASVRCLCTGCKHTGRATAGRCRRQDNRGRRRAAAVGAGADQQRAPRAARCDAGTPYSLALIDLHLIRNTIMKISGSDDDCPCVFLEHRELTGIDHICL